MHDNKFKSYNYKKKKTFSDHYAISCEIEFLILIIKNSYFFVDNETASL